MALEDGIADRRPTVRRGGRSLGRAWPITLVRAVSLAWLTLYCVLTIAYLLPASPVMRPLRPVLEATIGTYFEQDWGLFAPIPVSSDVVLLARPLSPAETAGLRPADLPGDGWHDLSTPLWTRSRHQPFSADYRLKNVLTRAAWQFLSEPAELGPWGSACESGDTLACDYYRSELQISQTRSRLLLARIGSAFGRDLAQAGQSISHVALRLRVVPGAPWPERTVAAPAASEYDVGIFPLDLDVPPLGLFPGGQAG